MVTADRSAWIIRQRRDRTPRSAVALGLPQSRRPLCDTDRCVSAPTLDSQGTKQAPQAVYFRLHRLLSGPAERADAPPSPDDHQISEQGAVEREFVEPGNVPGAIGSGEMNMELVHAERMVPSRVFVQPNY